MMNFVIIADKILIPVSINEDDTLSFKLEDLNEEDLVFIIDNCKVENIDYSNEMKKGFEWYKADSKMKIKNHQLLIEEISRILKRNFKK